MDHSNDFLKGGKIINYHVIKAGETLKRIALSYNLETGEITKINQHISNWERLVPGTKIRLPSISNQLSEEIDEVEPFIEDYYPKIELPIKEEKIEVSEEVKEEKTLNKSSAKKKTNHYRPPMYNPYYMYPYMYNNYYYTTRKKKSH